MAIKSPSKRSCQVRISIPLELWQETQADAPKTGLKHKPYLAVCIRHGRKPALAALLGQTETE